MTPYSRAKTGTAEEPQAMKLYPPETPAGTAVKSARAGVPPRGQPVRHSIVESLANILAGLGVAILANIFLLPLWGFSPTPSAALEIGLVFTLVSFIRSFVLRRLFNYIHMRQK